MKGMLGFLDSSEGREGWVLRSLGRWKSLMRRALRCGFSSVKNEQSGQLRLSRQVVVVVAELGMEMGR
jgi:hypothetical protein